MKAALARIEGWLATPGTLADLTLFRMLFCSALALQVVIYSREAWSFLTRRAPFDAAFDLPVPYLEHAPLLGLIDRPELVPLAFSGVTALLVVSLVGAALGWRTRACLAIALGACLLYFGTLLELGSVRRKANAIPFVLLILLMAPDIGRGGARGLARALRESSPTPAWPLVLVKLYLASTYLAAGFSKLRNTGGSWASGEVLQANLVGNALAHDLQLGYWLAGEPLLCRIAATGTLVFELGFWTVLLWPRLGPLYALAGLGFHAGIQIFMGIPYLRYWSLVYLVFVDGRLLRRLGRLPAEGRRA